MDSPPPKSLLLPPASPGSESTPQELPWNAQKSPSQLPIQSIEFQSPWDPLLRRNRHAIEPGISQPTDGSPSYMFRRFVLTASEVESMDAATRIEAAHVRDSTDAFRPLCATRSVRRKLNSEVGSEHDYPSCRDVVIQDDDALSGMDSSFFLAPEDSQEPGVDGDSSQDPSADVVRVNMDAGTVKRKLFAVVDGSETPRISQMLQDQRLVKEIGERNGFKFDSYSLSLSSELPDIRKWFPSYVYESKEESQDRQLVAALDSPDGNMSGSMFRSTKVVADPNSPAASPPSGCDIFKSGTPCSAASPSAAGCNRSVSMFRSANVVADPNSPAASPSSDCDRSGSMLRTTKVAADPNSSVASPPSGCDRFKLGTPFSAASPSSVSGCNRLRSGSPPSSVSSPSSK